MELKYPIPIFCQISHNLERQSIRKTKKKITKHVPTNFSVLGKRTNRSLAKTKHARSEKKIPTLGKKKKKSDQCWYLVVFGSKSVLLGVLLIKSLPSKCISQIRLDINNFFFLNTDQCALKKTKKEEEEEEDSIDDKRQERLLP